MTQRTDEIDGLIRDIYTRGQVARDEWWKRFEAFCVELRAKLYSGVAAVEDIERVAAMLNEAPPSLPGESEPAPLDPTTEAYRTEMMRRRDEALGYRG